MLRKFLSGSGLFALSVLLFSVVRQIVVFPAISRIDEQLFVSLTFMVFTFEAIAYAFAGAIPDYYVRHVQGCTVNAGLMHQLSRLCLLGLACIPVFYWLGIDGWTSFLLGLYLYLFALNALKIKLVFSKLRFAENFIYMAYRSVPYLLALGFVWKRPPGFHGNELQVVAALMLMFEFLYWLRLESVTREDMQAGQQKAAQSYGSLLTTLLPFVFSALLMGIIQRGDLTLVKLASVDYYTNYAKTILTINFFCAPLSLMISAPLLSFLSSHDLILASSSVRRLLLLIGGLILITGGGAAFAFDFVNGLLYGGASLDSSWMVFYLTVTTLFYALVRTLVVKYAAVRLVLSVNIMFVLSAVLMVICLPVQVFVMFFYGGRLLIYSLLLLVRRCGNEHQ